jgi:hypothetical protein
MDNDRTFEIGSSEKEEKPRFERLVIPNGFYLVTTISCEGKVGKTSGQKYFSWRMKLLEGNYAGRTFFCNTTLQDGKKWLFVQLMKACGIKKNESGNYRFTLAEVINKPVIADIRLRKNGDREESQVSGFLSEEEYFDQTGAVDKESKKKTDDDEDTPF